jgi:hypothetical protein
MEQVKAVRVQRTQTGTREYNAITVVLADLHLSCDVVNARQLRLAKHLADSHGAAFMVDPLLQAQVYQALQADGAHGARAQVSAGAAGDH